MKPRQVLMLEHSSKVPNKTISSCIVKVLLTGKPFTLKIQFIIFSQILKVMYKVLTAHFKS